MWYQVWLGKDLVSFGEEFNQTNVDMDALHNNLGNDKGIWKRFEIYLLENWLENSFY